MVGRALARWRGRPYDDLGDWEAVVPERRHLCELHARAREEWVALRLDLGETSSLVPLLEELVFEEPLAERRWELLLLTLYRSGRTGDALRAFQRARRALGEAGLEAGPGLVELDHAIASGGVPGARERRRIESIRGADAVTRAELAVAESGSGALSGLNPSADVLRMLDEALDALPKAPTALRAMVLGRLAVAGSSNRDPALVSSYADESLSTARLVADRSALLIAMHARLVTEHDPARLDECELLAREFLTIARDDPSAEVLARSILGRVRARRGDLDGASECADAAIALARGLAPDIELATLWYPLFRATLAGDRGAALAAKDVIGSAAQKALIDPDAAGSMTNAVEMVVHALFPDDAAAPAAPAIRLDGIAWPQANLGYLARRYRIVVRARRASRNRARNSRAREPGRTRAPRP